MPLTSAAQRRAQIELIAKKLTQGYTDTDVMEMLKIKRATFYNYKSRIWQIWGNLSAQKTERALAFETELLKDKLIRLHRTLEMYILNAKDEPIRDVAEACAIDAQLAIATFKLEFEGWKTRQLREVARYETQAIGRLHAFGDAGSELPEPDFTSTAAEGGPENKDSQDPTAANGDTEEKVY